MKVLDLQPRVTGHVSRVTFVPTDDGIPRGSSHSPVREIIKKSHPDLRAA